MTDNQDNWNDLALASNGDSNEVYDAPKKSHKKKTPITHDEFLLTDHMDMDGELTPAMQAAKLSDLRKVIRHYVLDVLAFAEGVIASASLPMDSIISLVDRFEVDGATDAEIKSAVRSQLRAGMIERNGRSYRLASLGRATADEMRGAFKNSFRRGV